MDETPLHFIPETDQPCRWHKTCTQVIAALKESKENPENLSMSSKDFFGDKIQPDETLKKLKELPMEAQFYSQMRACLEAVITVLERQYSKYFELDVTEKLKEDASARSHNIDHEEIMGMFSSVKQKSPNTNKTIDYLDNLTEEHRKEVVLSLAFHLVVVCYLVLLLFVIFTTQLNFHTVWKTHNLISKYLVLFLPNHTLCSLNLLRVCGQPSLQGSTNSSCLTVV